MDVKGPDSGQQDDVTQSPSAKRVKSDVALPGPSVLIAPRKLQKPDKSLVVPEPVRALKQVPGPSNRITELKLLGTGCNVTNYENITEQIVVPLSAASQVLDQVSDPSQQPPHPITSDGSLQLSVTTENEGSLPDEVVLDDD